MRWRVPRLTAARLLTARHLTISETSHRPCCRWVLALQADHCLMSTTSHDMQLASALCLHELLQPCHALALCSGDAPAWLVD
jgi:hypothetical protein